MPKTCPLCNSQHRKAIDQFLAMGATFPMFQEKFKKYAFAKVSKYTVYRHKQHITDDTPMPTGVNKELFAGTGVDTKYLLRLNQRLLGLATRAERAGRPQAAIQSYAAVSRNVELLTRLIKPEEPKPPEPQTQQEFDAQVEAFFKQPQLARWLKPEELDVQLAALIKKSDIGEWFRETLEKSYPEAVARHTEAIMEELLRGVKYRERLRRRIVVLDGEKIIEQMVTDVDVRERVRAALLEQDIGLAEQVAPVEHDAPAVPAAERSMRELLANGEQRAEAISILTADYWPQWCEATAAKNQLLRDYGQPYDCCWYPPREIRKPA